MPPLARRLLVAVPIFFFSIVASMADPRLEKWFSVPPDQSGVALLIDSPISFASISSGGKVVDAAKWNSKTPFVYQFRVKPGNYELRLQGPITRIGVDAKAGSLTYLHFGTFLDKDGKLGTYIATTYSATYRGQDVAELLEKAAAIGTSDVFFAKFVPTDGNILTLSTDPPWPIPPVPPPKR